MIVINLNKAKEIAHSIRREKRAEEFKPFDEVIMKQIPGNDLVQAETARQAIREKYAVLQENINSSSTVEELKTCLSSMTVTSNN